MLQKIKHKRNGLRPPFVGSTTCGDCKTEIDGGVNDVTAEVAGGTTGDNIEYGEKTGL